MLINGGVMPNKRKIEFADRKEAEAYLRRCREERAKAEAEAAANGTQADTSC